MSLLLPALTVLSLAVPPPPGFAATQAAPGAGEGPTREALEAALGAAVAATEVPGSELSLLLAATASPTGRTLDDAHLPDFPADARAWHRRAAALRARVRLATGQLVDASGPAPGARGRPAVRVTRRVEREGYAVEAVAFEVLPGVWATGSLYRPAGEVPARSRPAVLTPHGHWADGRFQSRGDAEVQAELASGRERLAVAARHPLQARCVAFARAGWVVLHHDMVGYADHTQLDHREGLGDAECLAWGVSHAELQTLTSVVALDVLGTLPEVDPERLAVTGASGGGTQTFLLCAVDGRPLVSAPVNMVSGVMQGGCICENAAHLRVGTDNVELAALHAPGPQLLVAADDWTRALGERDARELRALYRTLGAPDALEVAAFLDHPHNYDAASRGAVLDFLLRELGPGPGVDPAAAREERAFVPLTRAELTVWGDGVPRPDLDARGVREALLARARSQRAALLADPARHRDAVRAALAVLTGLQDRRERGPREPNRLLAGADPHAALGWSWIAIPARTTGLRVGEADDRERVALLLGGVRRADERLTLLALPGGAPRLLAEARGEGGQRTAVLPLVQRLLGEGETLLVVDVAPPTAPPRTDPGRHASSPHFSLAYTLTGIADAVRTLTWWLDETLRARPRLVGIDEAGPLALLAAPLALRPLRQVAADLAWTFDDPEAPDDGRLLPGASRFGGVDGFAALAAPAPLLLGGCAEAPPFVRAAYGGAERAAALATTPGSVASALADVPARAAPEPPGVERTRGGEDRMR